ncbi:MAG: dual OB domain-containing protein [Bryobacteraceae bacterium]
MPVFDILCLANSSKWRGSCIAGLRLDGGGWIRPVARTSHGELYPDYFALQDGSYPQLFDRIRISFIERTPSPHQPENWLIADQPWQLISRGLSPESAALLESNLADGPALLGDYSHKIYAARFEAEPATSSLCLVRPANLSWAIEQTPYNARKASAQFQLDGTSYRLPVTDPAWLNAFRALPPGRHPVTACGIAAEFKILLTVSLGSPWEDGYCYKLVAGILPLDPCRLAGPVRPEPSGPPMDTSEAIWIIQALASGTDPYTGESLPGDGPLSNPDTILALRAAAAALQSGPPPKRRRELPAQAGKSWDVAEEEILVREFEAGETMAAIAHSHGRTPGAIKSRLIRLGKIAD